MEILLALFFYPAVYLLVLVFSIMYILMFIKEAWARCGTFLHPRERDKAPSCLHDVNIGSHHTLTLGRRENLNIHYVANGSREKPLMLFLHGFPDFWYGWRYQLKEFSKDYYAVAIDLTGCGQSSKPDAVKRYRMLEIAKDVKECITELGYSSCVLVGHDWGGGIAYNVAGEFPDVVSELIILNTPHPGAFLRGLFSMKQLMMSSYMFFFQLCYLPEYFLSYGDFAIFDSSLNGRVFTNLENFTRDDLEAYKYNFQKSGFTTPLNYYRMAFEKPTKKMLTMRITMPAIIIWGTGDQVLSPALAAPSAKYFDQVDVKYIDGVAHWPHVDQPETVNRYIREFFDSL
ncbi:epoxide hydrolase 1-like [Hydractinia symbiolongicarpus]|uniref:epoxide hydrolase 1-like n=1 Tax=Hydractinia symbiolongicarpus TaxID=13093 RepID=UPI00254F0642|nr:epoxide hydrolase 1-like [Hydractinia symbiolongicarpus]XP_057294196.1 epoxide hydrolase 1-like [Hydractinia symbiolongicarpus]